MGTLFQGKDIHNLEGTRYISVSFEKYGCLPISPIGRIKQMSVKPSSQNGYLTVQIWTMNIINDFGSNRFRKCGKCCPMWTTKYKIGNGCVTVSQSLLLILTYVLSFTYMWSGLNPYKSRALSIFYYKNGPV